MANTITNNRVVLGKDLVVQQIQILSDGTEETDLVIYDSSVVATALGKTDPLTSTLLRVQITGINAATVNSLTFEYDATTDVIALPVDIGSPVTYAGVIDIDFTEIGGIVNLAKGTSGATGDILLTSTAFDAGDRLLINLFVKPY